MKAAVKCPKCGHIIKEKPALLADRAELQERLRQLAFELESIIFHRGLLAEEERRVRREQWELEQQLGG
jgi:hypothetical protein